MISPKLPWICIESLSASSSRIPTIQWVFEKTGDLHVSIGQTRFESTILCSTFIPGLGTLSSQSISSLKTTFES